MKKSTPFLSVAALAGLTASLNAVTILNPSFEADVSPSATGLFGQGGADAFGGSFTGWSFVTTENGPTADLGNAGVGFVSLTPADGNQVMVVVAGGSISQFTDVAWSSLTVGDSFTMTVAVGDRTNTGAPVWADQSFFAIIDNATISSVTGVGAGTLADGTLLANTVANSGELATPFAGGGGINGGTFEDRSFSYTVQLSDLSRAGNVGVLLAALGQADSTNIGTASSGNQAFFDNVRLDVVPVPEPSAALLGGLGMLALLRRRRD